MSLISGPNLQGRMWSEGSGSFPQLGNSHCTHFIHAFTVVICANADVLMVNLHILEIAGHPEPFRIIRFSQFVPPDPPGKPVNDTSGPMSGLSRSAGAKKHRRPLEPWFMMLRRHGENRGDKLHCCVYGKSSRTQAVNRFDRKAEIMTAWVQ